MMLLTLVQEAGIALLNGHEHYCTGRFGIYD